MDEYGISTVVRIDNTDYMIVDFPKRKNQVNYKMVAKNGNLYKVHKTVLDIQAKIVGKDPQWLREYQRSDIVDSSTTENRSLNSGDEVVVKTSGKSEINGKIAYVVKVNAKTVQIVIPHIGAWNVSPEFLTRNI